MRAQVQQIEELRRQVSQETAIPKAALIQRIEERPRKAMESAE